MFGRRTRNLLSYLVFGAGLFLLGRGAREFWESQSGQMDAAREFQKPAREKPASGQPAPPIRVEPELGATLAKLSIPRLNAEIYVVEGVDDQELRRGPGHMPGTSMPGDRGNCVIAGHRDTHFRVLKDIRKGDRIVLDTRTGQFVYRVKSTEVVSPNNTASLQPTSGPVLHLITCFPFYYVGSAPKRMVVQADLTDSRPPSAT